MKTLIIVSSLLLSVIQPLAQELKSSKEVVQENLQFYNKSDIDGFMSSFADSITLYNLGKSEPIANGKEAIRNLYKGLFDTSPKLHSTILNRTIIGNKVIDYELIKGRRGSKSPIKLVMIYEVTGGKISRMTVIRE
jgi:hypothetical protein